MKPEEEQDHAALVLKLGRDRRLAHQFLFSHRHPDATPPFHLEIIDLWHSPQPNALVMVFREGGKSTIAEEAFLIGAGFQLFHNAMIIGSTERRACERLRAIKHEIVHNEKLRVLFGELKGDVWNEAEVILGNGVRIVALGRGQSLRGTKHLHYRPDFCFCDDLEDEDAVRDEKARDECLKWFMSTVVPALDKHARIRVNATPLDRQALPYQLQERLKWPTKIYPIEYVDEHGERQATWPGRYPLSWIDKKKEAFAAVGKNDDYMREYMCVADDPKRKLFTADLFKVKPQVRTWQPTYAFFDPARTVKANSATTGWAVWSWIANRLIVWDGGGDFWQPDQIVDQIFKVDNEYRPVHIGVEEDGLNEFLMQPLRAEMVRRGYYVPVVPWRAPKGKLAFIESLQPFFRAGEVSFATELPELRAQFLNYPSGRIDGPNALAYALLMRPGQAVYDFGGLNVADELRLPPRVQPWLAVNARAGYTTGVLAGMVGGGLWVIKDFVREGDPGSCVEAIAKEAALESFDPLRLVCPPEHFGRYNPLGLRGAVAKIPAEVRRGAEPGVGCAELRALLGKSIRETPALRVAMAARWTVNALASGYAYAIEKTGRIATEPREGPYRCLIEGLECFAGLARGGVLEENRPNLARTASGQLYISALPGQRGPVDDKASFLGNR